MNFLEIQICMKPQLVDHIEGDRLFIYYKNFMIINNRQRPSCGDIDIILTRKDGQPYDDFMQKLINKLTEEKKLLTD